MADVKNIVAQDFAAEVRRCFNSGSVLMLCTTPLFGMDIFVIPFVLIDAVFRTGGAATGA